MADEEEEKKGGKKKLIMIVVPAVLVLAGGGYFMMGGGGDPEAEAAAAAAAEAEAAANPVEGEVIEIGKMTVSLMTEPEEPLRYARVGLAVVLSETADSAFVGGRVPLLQDSALTVISGMSADDLRTPTGMNEVRDLLTAQALEIFPDGDVIRVVLTELIVQ